MQNNTTPFKQRYFAIASLMIGVCGLPFLGMWGVGAIIGLTLGVIALVKIKKRPAQFAGKSSAIAGVTINGISLILAVAILVPPIVTTGLARNETSAVSSLLSVYEAEARFRSKSHANKYGTLGELAEAGLIESDLGSGAKNGYRFEVRVKADSFEAVGTPLRYGGRWGFRRTGIRSFYIDESGIIHNADNGGREANASDPPID